MLPAIGPGRCRQWEIRRPENVGRADVTTNAETHSIIPASEVTLALEQLRRLQRISFRRQTIRIRLVIGVLEFIRTPPEGAFGKHDFQLRKPVQHAREKKI